MGRVIRTERDLDGRGESAQCFATTGLTVTECDRLAALPDPVEPARLDLTCELAIGHTDHHIAFAVAAHSGNQQWWLRWNGRLRDVVHIELCDGRDADEHNDCLLPHGHDGPHSFAIRPVHKLSPRRSEDAEVAGVGDGFAAPFGAELAVDGSHVCLDRVDRHA
ncbi:hypothetical protein Vau01_117220 [Virgisporangium aurantiacum]|uniref:Uncharacterized protein n=1 Tax=Virgisporangium aurantiacum TaxID=175570 RepID=A0A8J3ZMF1_9ACTN|nr:hypothetical protein Vau01_117220 [Virgisporangium aurantiacum]